MMNKGNKNDNNGKNSNNSKQKADWEFPMVAILFIIILIVPLAISIWDIGSPIPGKK